MQLSSASVMTHNRQALTFKAMPLVVTPPGLSVWLLGWGVVLPPSHGTACGSEDCPPHDTAQQHNDS